jgi:PTS system nitrogen regulatory IIA component
VRLTIRDAARYLAVPEDTLYRWIRDGEIPFTRINDQYRLSSDDLLEWATARGINVHVDILQHAHQDIAPSFVDALRSGGAHRYDGPSDRNSILAALVQELPFEEESDRSALLELLIAREGLGSTGIGQGIAIPHARAPVVLQGAEPSIALWYLEHSVDFGAQDQVAVDTVFFMMTPTPRVHLQLLSRLASALHDREFRDAVKDGAPLERILEQAQRLELTFSSHARDQVG